MLKFRKVKTFESLEKLFNNIKYSLTDDAEIINMYHLADHRRAELAAGGRLFYLGQVPKAVCGVTMPAAELAPRPIGGWLGMTLLSAAAMLLVYLWFLLQHACALTPARIASLLTSGAVLAFHLLAAEVPVSPLAALPPLLILWLLVRVLLGIKIFAFAPVSDNLAPRVLFPPVLAAAVLVPCIKQALTTRASDVYPALSRGSIRADKAEWRVVVARTVQTSPLLAVKEVLMAAQWNIPPLCAREMGCRTPFNAQIMPAVSYFRYGNEWLPDAVRRHRAGEQLCAD